MPSGASIVAVAADVCVTVVTTGGASGIVQDAESDEVQPNNANVVVPLSPQVSTWMGVPGPVFATGPVRSAASVSAAPEPSRTWRYGASATGISACAVISPAGDDGSVNAGSAWATPGADTTASPAPTTTSPVSFPHHERMCPPSPSKHDDRRDRSRCYDDGGRR